MTRTIERRVAQLEATTDGGGECPECGNGPDDDKRPYEIVFVDPDDTRPDEWCPACGRALHITITMSWGGAMRGGTRARYGLPNPPNARYRRRVT